jgi:CrcB protein
VRHLTLAGAGTTQTLGAGVDPTPDASAVSALPTGWLGEELMNSLLIVAGGGALGAGARYLVYIAAAHVLGGGFPFGTLIVNILGSFIMGVLTETMALVWSASSEMRLFMAVGFLGAFTTFSTFSLDFAVLYERGQFFLCAVYVSVSVACSIGAIFTGMLLFRRLLSPAI